MVILQQEALRDASRDAFRRDKNIAPVIIQIYG